MNNSNILVVEDDAAIRSLITTALETENYKYHVAKNGSQAIMEAATQAPELILLDLGLPDIDGVDVIRKIRTWSTVPITVISARSEDKDKINAWMPVLMIILPSHFQQRNFLQESEETIGEFSTYKIISRGEILPFIMVA